MWIPRENIRLMSGSDPQKQNVCRARVWIVSSLWGLNGSAQRVAELVKLTLYFYKSKHLFNPVWFRAGLEPPHFTIVFFNLSTSSKLPKVKVREVRNRQLTKEVRLVPFILHQKEQNQIDASHCGKPAQFPDLNIRAALG